MYTAIDSVEAATVRRGFSHAAENSHSSLLSTRLTHPFASVAPNLDVRLFELPNRNDTRGQHERKTQYADPWIAAGCISPAVSSGISAPLRQNVPSPAGSEIRHFPGGGGSEPPGAGTEDGRGL